MKNRLNDVGLHYMQRTYYELSHLLAEGHGEEGEPGEPLKFKVYRGLPGYPLRQTLPLTLGDARCAFAASLPGENGTDTLDDERLSTLLYYTYGFSRHDSGVDVRWPLHRVVPSARCFFPAELYLWTPGAETVPAGIYHYDNLHHSLTALRQGEYRELLGSLLACDLSDCLGVLLISAYFWKNAFRYRNFSYRLCSQETGIVLGNAQLVAGTLGLRTRAHYHFLDAPAARLLGFEENEESLFVALALYPASTDLSWSVRRQEVVNDQALQAALETITPQHIKLSALDQELCSLLIEIDQHSYLESTDEFVHTSSPPSVTCEANDRRIAPPAPLTRSLELANALHTRNSGDVLFTPLRLPLAFQEFWEIIRYSVAPYASDLFERPAHPFVQLYLAVNHVSDLPGGVYRLCPTCGELHVIEQRDVSAETLAIHSTPTVSCATANAVVYLAADYPALQAAFGNRAYRIMNLECGLISQRICALSAAFGLAARCSDSYFMDKCERLLHLTDQPAMPIFQIALGYERPGAGTRYRHAIRF